MLVFYFIWQFIQKQKWKFTALCVLSLIWTFDMVFWPYILRWIVDTFSFYDTNRAASWSVLKVLLLYASGFWVFVEVAFRARDFVSAFAFPKMEAEIRMAMFDHIQRHSPKYFNEHFAGSLSNKIGDMVASVTSMLRTIFVFFLPCLCSCITTMIIFFQIHPFLAFLVSCWVVIHFSISIAFTPKCASYAHLQGEARTTLVGKIVDSLTNHFSVNLFYRFSFEKKRVALYQKEEEKRNREAQLYTAKMFTCLSLFWVVVVFSVTALSIRYWMQESVTSGEVVQLFYTLWNLSFMVWMIADLAPQFFQSVGIAKQAFSVLEDPQDLHDIVDAKQIHVTKGEIVFENVSFQYGEKAIFQNKNLTIRGGEKIGLVGYSGAGKSTFVNLILRFFQVEKGKILIDGQDISGVSLQSLRENIALIPQDPSLFHRSLEENIRYGKEDASHEEIVRAAKQAHCHEFIQNTRDGYLSLVGERGAKLSGGEKQRIVIARAMLKQTPILILDEATSALDSVTEQYIQESLGKLMDKRTTIVVAHRLSTLAKMDRILVFNQGKIIEQGSHEELLQRRGHYAQMWAMQAGGFLPDGPVRA